MFVLLARYTPPTEEVDRHLESHTAWITRHQEAGGILMSARQVPLTGGLILAEGRSADDMREMLSEDPSSRRGSPSTRCSSSSPSREGGPPGRGGAHHRTARAAAGGGGPVPARAAARGEPVLRGRRGGLLAPPAVQRDRGRCLWALEAALVAYVVGRAFADDLWLGLVSALATSVLSGSSLAVLERRVRRRGAAVTRPD